MDDDDEYFPHIGGTGSLYDLRDADEPTPRLAGMKSVSRAAARALTTRSPGRARPIGFVHGRVR